MITTDLIGSTHFQTALKNAIDRFSDNAFIGLIKEGRLTRRHYAKLLKLLYHQVKSGPLSFALAAQHTSESQESLRAYLLLHAAEEESHYTWIVADLKNIGVDDASSSFEITPAVEQYIAYNEFVARRSPLRRLAIASVLEGLGGTVGSGLAAVAFKQLELDAGRATFFTSHAITDAKHMLEIRGIIESCEPSAETWEKLIETAEITATLYSAIYNEASRI